MADDKPAGDRTEEQSVEERHNEAMKRRDEAREQEREAAASYDSPAYAKGPQDVPAPGADPDSLMRAVKHAEASTRDLSDKARAAVVSAAEDSGAEDDDDDPDKRTDAQRAADERKRAAEQSGQPGSAATVAGRKAQPKSTT